MTLYPILRGDVSQIIIHILENWNFGGENSTESKKKKGFFSEFAIGKETFEQIKKILA